MTLLKLVCSLKDGRELVLWTQAGHRWDGHAGCDAALEARYSHHEELVEVGAEDRKEVGAFKQEEVRVFGQLEDAQVEIKP